MMLEDDTIEQPLSTKEKLKRCLFNKQTLIRLAIVFVIATTLIICALSLPVKHYAESFLLLLQDTKSWRGPMIFMGVYIASNLLFIPDGIFQLGAGFIYGVLWGTVYVWIAAMIGNLYFFFFF